MPGQAPERIYAVAGKTKKFIVHDFAEDLDGTSIASIVDITISSGGPTEASRSFSGTEAQAYYDFTGVSTGEYTIDITVTDDAAVAQTFIGRGILVVAALGVT